MDVDQAVEARPQKKAKTKKNSVNTTKPKADSSDEERVIQNMGPYMDKLDWEGLVKNVDTVERDGDGLVVFFTLYVHWRFPGSMSKHF